MIKLPKKQKEIPNGYIDISGLILQENDCFCRGFDEFSSICTGYGIEGEGCHARGLCQLGSHHITTKKNIKAIKKAKGTLLDEIDFSKVNETKLVAFLKQKSGTVSIIDLTRNIAKTVGATDKLGVVRLYLAGLVELHGFVLIDNIIIFNG